MTRLPLRRLAILIVGALAACSRTTLRQGQQTQSTTLTPPAQFLVDKEGTDLAAIVKVKRAENRWVILPDGDHAPLVVAECEMEQVLSGSHGWSIGAVQTVVQYDYTDLISDPIAPPVIEGRRYILFAFTTPKDGNVLALAPWTAHPQGFLLLRGRRDREFVFWSGKSYAAAAIREALVTGRPLPLDQIVDPVRRLRVAEARIEQGALGDEKAFIHGLLVNVLDPDGQAKSVEQGPANGTSTDKFGLNEGVHKPHAIWYKSLALLRDLGRDATRRRQVAAALTPVAQTAAPRIRLAAALALVDLGSDAGREALIRGFESESGEISSDPSDDMTFPDRYPYDHSSITACAHALARLGDRRGLKHPKPDVRLATAEALGDKPDPEIRKTLETLAAELELQVDKLRASGKLTKSRGPGDYTNRYPTDWVRTQRLLARFGDDQGFRRLVEAYIVDASTYPKKEAPLMPRGRPSSWSSGPSPTLAIGGANDTPSQVLERLRKLFAQDGRWDSPSFKMLRASLEEPRPDESKEAAEHKPTEAEIARLLRDADPERRSDGLAAAGYHRVDTFYAQVLDVSLNGRGIERNAAIYALGLYGRDVPEATLRRLIALDDMELRSSAIELATRKDAARFALETMSLVRTVLERAGKVKSDDGQTEEDLDYLPRILCRLARGPIPQAMLDGLKDPDPAVRRIVVQALALSGNPEAVPKIEPLTRDSDLATRTASQAALRSLGPADPQ